MLYLIFHINLTFNMNILLIEPYYTGSHRAWSEGLQFHSRHEIEILSMKGQFWKWRMHGGAISLANQFNELHSKPDLILATSMVDLTTFLALTREKTNGIPTAIYFHENQLSYPWSPTDRDVVENRNKHYGFINYSSALAADHVLFNSNYHKESFIDEAKNLLKHFPDYNEFDTINEIEAKSSVLYLGMDLEKFDPFKNDNEGPPLILWNHRWEYDKNPEAFFKTLFQLDNEEYDFQLAVLGENFKTSPSIFNEAKEKLENKIVHFGFCESFEDYAQWLWIADILPVTNIQDFFGMSIMEAIYCNTYPLLPNRLTYPELLPDKYHKDQIYKDDVDLFMKLKNAITDILKTRKLNFSSIAEKFDWSNMAPIYDELFSSFID